MKDDPVSAMADGAMATIWSSAACWAGLTWAYAITTRQWPPSVTLLSLAAASVLFGTAQERGWFVRLGRPLSP